ncbi:MAG TPA: PAS domain S-box protein, partial [Bacteroidia bacterium]|nr:PAS domain S-box protein [Bacteroidia bacterium]
MEQKAISLESEAGFKVLFECATIGIIVVGRKGEVELANPCAEKLFGYTNTELIGQPLEVLIPDNFRTRHTKHREGYFSNPVPRSMGLGMELFAKAKDGKIFPVEISLGHYELAGKQLAVAFVTDITLRKKAEDELRRSKDELEKRVEERTQELTEALGREKELSEMKSRFVSMASHEFRTPLSAVLSSASLVEQYARLGQSDKWGKHISRIKSSVKDLTEILNDFLSLEKLESGKVEIEKDQFDLEELAKDVLEQVNNMLKTGQVIYHVHSGEKEIVLDKRMLRNVLLNLLSNAIKYSGDGKEIHFKTEVNDET